MKFYNREIEIQPLRKIEDTSKSCAQMTVITGRRIGKTSSSEPTVLTGFNERGESYTGVESGKYLDKLENTHDLLYRPISRHPTEQKADAICKKQENKFHCAFA